jgi:hypothetical protein
MRKCGGEYKRSKGSGTPLIRIKEKLMMYHLEVGKLYPARLPESVQYNYRGGHHELLMVLGGLRDKEIEDIRKGPCEFGLLVHGPVIFFLYRFGTSIPWSDTPYSWWLMPEHDQSIVPAAGTLETRALLQVILVEQETAIVRGLRAVSLSPEFTQALHEAITKQSEGEWPGRDEYDKVLNSCYLRWPSGEDMLTEAKVRTRGGA